MEMSNVTEEQDYIEIDFDDDCYLTSCAMIKMWYRRSQKIKKQQEKEHNKYQ